MHAHVVSSLLWAVGFATGNRVLVQGHVQVVAPQVKVKPTPVAPVVFVEELQLAAG